MVRVRFAPSPTGALHVGSARTALFNWLFAKHEHGVFILRIEDTDQKRSDPAHLKDIQEGLSFLGIIPDEGPIAQSERFDLYRQYATQLVDAGKAMEQEGAIVFPVSPQQLTFHDLLHGDITVDTSLFESLVLMKSDGSPTYHFACVVDDATMKITHVIRGDDHIANTPKQLVLFQALGWEPPQYVHIPLIVGADRARLSKRLGATSVSAYKAEGYLPEAFVNYLALLGWSPGGNKEVMSQEELLREFDLTRVRKTAAQFDQQKLDWLNGQHLKRLSPERLTELCAGWLTAKGVVPQGYDQSRLSRIATLLQARLKTLRDLEEEHIFFFQESITYEDEAVKKFLRQDSIGRKLTMLKDRLSRLDPFETEAIEHETRALIAEEGLKPKDLIHPVRVAVTGRAVSPPLFEVLSILGKETVIRRLGYAVEHLTS